MTWSRLPEVSGEGGDPTPVGKVLDAVLAGLGTPSVDALVLVHRGWADIVGDEVAAHSRPAGIESGCLTVVADGPAWASHLRWAEVEILEKLTRSLGPGQVVNMRVRVAR